MIVHDLAPRARALPWYDLVGARLGDHVDLVEVHVESFAAAETAARRAAATSADLVIAVGGDGTVNACVNGIGAARTRLAVVPAGTANDLARIIGQSGEPEDLVFWEPREIDALTVNDTRFYSVGGFGWAAQVAETANRWRAGGLRRRVLAQLGSVLYMIACLFVIAFARRIGGRFRVRYTDADSGLERDLDVDAYTVLAANFDSVGSSFKLAESSDPADGIFELLIVPRRGRLRLFATAWAASRGRLLELPEVQCLRATRATVETDEPMNFFGEGETLTTAQRFELAVSDTPLRLMAPMTELIIEMEAEPAGPLDTGPWPAIGEPTRTFHGG
jgi:diacylglycerol kinase (ATP)